MNGIRTRKRTATVVVIAVVIVVIAAVISLQPHAPDVVVVNSSKTVAFAWQNKNLSSVGYIVGNVTSYLHVLNNNATNSSLTFSATLWAGNVNINEREQEYQFYTNITGNISSALHPDYITFTLNDYGNNTNYVQSGDVLSSYSIPTPADNISLINNGVNTSFRNIGSLSYSAKLLRVTATGHSAYHFHFNGVTEIVLSYSSMANKTTINTFHLYAQLKGLSKVVTCELTFVITTVA